ncbi:acetyl-CoA synthetase-like protein [Crucibulum laeve]|uniref:Acetyl-CoA synthetase-like protein n=1 Tax=Crucibulum laeve TaxID=68775 RepID=A0A5C3M352_9AGAR|nr:acetyl-CoA synthetase-like protein [Crucibulum laeve]
MPIPLSFLRGFSELPDELSLGEFIAQQLAEARTVNNLLDCLCSNSRPAIFSTDASRPPLHHHELRSFVSSFQLPRSASNDALGPNDRVMLMVPTGPENAVALLALSCYHTCAPVSASCTAAELKDDALRLRVKAVVTTEDAGQRLELNKLQEELGCEIIFIQPRSSGPSGLFDMSLMGGLPAETPHTRSTPHALTDYSLVLHTSGTSGRKKVVPYTLQTLLVGTWSVVDSWTLQPDDVNLNMMPLFHVGGIVRNLMAPVLSGGSAVMCPGFDAAGFWSLAQQFNATWYYAAPTIHHAILSAQPDDLNVSNNLKLRMICNAAGGLLPSLAEELKRTFGAVILPSYGMTECMPIATPPIDYQLDRPGCSGQACGPHLSIRNPNDLELQLPVGTTGAVCVRGLPTFDGYEISPDRNVPLDTSSFSSEGWFDSGDIGYLDVDRYLYITGRSKEIINKGGEVISPFEVEEAITTAAKLYVKNVLAFAVDHVVLQEAIGVVVVPVAGKPRVGLQQLHGLLNNHLHASKWPFVIVYMEDLPKNSAGKPLRIKLSKRLGLGQFAESTSLLDRHFEAVAPDCRTSLSDSIQCSKVSADLHAVESALASVSGVKTVASHSRHGSVEAYISTDGQLKLDVHEMKEHMSRILPGYCIPEPLHIFTQSLPKTDDGEVDFNRMEEEVAQRNSLTMSPRELLLRNIVADLLVIEPASVTLSSDFFLLGGNSLLLGRLSYLIRKQIGVSINVATLFTSSTISGIASLVESEYVRSQPHGFDEKKIQGSAATSVTAFTLPYDDNISIKGSSSKHSRPRGQTHPLCLIIQAFPLILFYPLKTALTWSMLLFSLAYLAQYIDGTFKQRMAALVLAIIIARLCARVICPIAAILFKWIVIGRYKPGTYRMWSVYYLRWWIVNQSLRIAGRGIFSMHPSLEILYYRLLGAKIGKDVHIDKYARLSEHDLLTIRDGCRIDTSLVRGFCVERDGYFRLDNIVIGSDAVLNTYTMISPGANIPGGTVYGPHASSHDSPSPDSYAAYNRTLLLEPHWLLKVFVAWPAIALVSILSYIPWFVAIWLMIDQTIVPRNGLNAVESVIKWFAAPRRVLFHALSRVVRALFTPLLQLILGIIVKRAFGLNTESSTKQMSQLSLLRRYINATLLSQEILQHAFSILGTHYEVVSAAYRAMGAKIGKHVYWPGTGIYCLDPELLEVGDDVVFGSRSELFTTDGLGSGRITIGNGAMIADRVVLLPGTRVGSRAVMGSGTLGKRDTFYPVGSTWLGNENGEALCFNPGSKETNISDTLTPFGRAFYKREVDYFVYPYLLILTINTFIAALSAAYWSISAVSSAQILYYTYTHMQRRLFQPSWYRLGILYGLIALCFVIVLNIQAVLALLWVIFTKWLVIGRRVEGRCDWDKSTYCQRWQLHLVLSRFLSKGYGNGGVLGPLTGSAYIVWYLRALGAKIGNNCSIFAGGRTGLMTEPDLVELGDNVNLDDCSVVAHINTRGNFSLNKLKIGNGCALRSGSRLLSGASMEDNSMLSEHALLTSGEVAEAGKIYIGWPAKRLEGPIHTGSPLRPRNNPSSSSNLICPICHNFPEDSSVTACGHLLCTSYITRTLALRKKCPVCQKSSLPSNVTKVQPELVRHT